MHIMDRYWGKQFNRVLGTIMVILVALLASACTLEKTPDNLSAVRLTTPGSKAIMSLFYGPIDFTSLDFNDFQIFYRAVPLDDVENAYGDTGDNFKRLSSTLEPFYLSQGHWHIEVRVLPPETTETTISKDKIQDKALLFGETDTYINLLTTVVTIKVGFPSDGNGNLFLAYSTPIFSWTNLDMDLGDPGDLKGNSTEQYTEQDGSATYKEKIITVSVLRLEEGVLSPFQEYYPDKLVSYDGNGNRTETPGLYLTATEEETSRVWHLLDSSNKDTSTNTTISFPTGNYLFVIQDIETSVGSDVIARNYYEKDSSGIWVPNGTTEYTYSNVVRDYISYTSLYGETIAAYVAPKMTTIIKGNSEFAVEEITVDADTTTIPHDCAHTDVHYYMNQYGEYCAFCAKGNIQAMQAAVTSHQYYYKRSDGIYCVVDLASIHLSPESKDSATKLTYAWLGYDRARAAAKREYEAGTYRFTSFIEDTNAPENSSTQILSTDKNFLKDGQFYYFLNFDGVLASFDKASDPDIATLSKNTHLTCTDNNQNVTYSYIYNSSNWNETQIHATSEMKVNQYTYINAQGIYERTETTSSSKDIFYYDNETARRALEAGQKFCILFINRTYFDNGAASTTFTGKTLVALSYNMGFTMQNNTKVALVASTVLPTVNGETHALINEFNNTKLDINKNYNANEATAYRKYIWDASADWEVYQIMDRYNGIVSDNEATWGVGMTAYTPSNSTTQRGNNFTCFMAGLDNTYTKAANLSNPDPGYTTKNKNLLSNINLRWEFFIDHNRDVVFVNGFNSNNLVKAKKYAILLSRPYFVYFNDPDNTWGDATVEDGNNNTQKVYIKENGQIKNADWVSKYKKDGRFVPVLSDVLTRYAAGAYDTYVSGLDGKEMKNLPAITPTNKVEGQYAYFANDVLGLSSSGIYLSLAKDQDENVEALSSAIGFYINRYGEVVSSGNDALAKNWADAAGCVYYVDSRGTYNTIGTAPIPLEGIDSTELVFVNNTTTTISRELMTRIAAIRNSGAEYYYNAYGQYLKTGYNPSIFHTVTTSTT